MWNRFRNRRDTGNARANVVEMPASGDLRPEQVYLDAARHQVDRQIDTFNELNARATQLFSIATIVLSLSVTLLTIAAPATSVPRCAEWLLIGAVVAYAVVVVCFLGSWLIRALEYRPDLSTLRTHSESVAGAVLMRWVANEYLESNQRNEPILSRKSRWVGWIGLFLCVETGLLAVGALLITL